MRKYTNKVEIKDPPIREFRKKRSCFARTCLSGCGCIIIFVLAFLLLLKFTAKPAIKELKNLPEYLSGAVPIYDESSINKIEFTSGKNRWKIIEGMAYLPKIIVAPIMIELKRIKDPKIETTDNEESYFDWTEFKEIVKEPIADHRDVFNIEWTNLAAQPSFIHEYYQTELTKENFSIDISSENEKVNQFTFSKDNIDGVIYVQDDLIERGTDYVLLKIRIPSEK
jgi:hypothetical protein